MGSAGGTQKKRKAVVRKGLAETQEYESNRLDDMDLDTDVHKGELSFIPSAVSSSAGWNESKFMCDRQCREEGFTYFDVASRRLPRAEPRREEGAKGER